MRWDFAVNAVQWVWFEVRGKWQVWEDVCGKGNRSVCRREWGLGLRTMTLAPLQVFQPVCLPTHWSGVGGQT